jgi:hypothetical protein
MDFRMRISFGVAAWVAAAFYRPGNLRPAEGCRRGCAGGRDDWRDRLDDHRSRATRAGIARAGQAPGMNGFEPFAFISLPTAVGLSIAIGLLGGAACLGGAPHPVISKRPFAARGACVHVQHASVVLCTRSNTQWRPHPL